ncbi:flagellar biosynthetic protein FliO [Bacillus sp. REN3]|uniref:flagellar biosynthetic protein FliO n=1 Tax=Bacillus sp. REN3 TaxID=2802440 RepID=UPI001FED9D7B|nr:flagellar biosynthetic protein FliO [Bacillus sp. REN3]
MSRLLKTATAVLFLITALLSPHGMASAEQQNKSAKDCVENPASCDDWQPGKAGINKTKDTKTTVGVTFWDFLKMIFATIFVAGLLYSLLKFINKKGASYKRSQLVENLGGTSLGGNRSIQVVKAGNRLLVVGVGENIQLLKEIDDPEEYSQVIKEYNNKMDQLAQPSDIVSKIRGKMKKDGKNEYTSFTDLLKEQLDDMSGGRKKLLQELKKKGSGKDE